MNQKGFIKDIVIIVLGILLLGGGYFYFSKKPAYAPAEKTNQISDETKDWKTYRNEEYGYGFKYPKDFYIKEDKEDSTSRAVTQRVYLVSDNTDWSIGSGVDLRSFGEVKNSTTQIINPNKMSQIKVSGISGSLKIEGKSTMSGDIYMDVLVPGKIGTFYLSFSGSKLSPDLENIFNKIITTYKVK